MVIMVIILLVKLVSECNVLVSIIEDWVIKLMISFIRYNSRFIVFLIMSMWVIVWFFDVFLFIVDN